MVRENLGGDCRCLRKSSIRTALISQYPFVWGEDMLLSSVLGCSSYQAFVSCLESMSISRNAPSLDPVTSIQTLSDSLSGIRNLVKVCCAKGWRYPWSLNSCFLHLIADTFEGSGLQLFNFILSSPIPVLNLLPSMSKVTKKKAPVDLDFTLRRVFGKTSFRYCLCDRLLAQDADGA